MLLGSRGNYFQGSWEINALFSGIKGAQTPPPPGVGGSSFYFKNILKFKVMYNRVFFSDKFTKYNKIENRSCFF